MKNRRSKWAAELFFLGIPAMVFSFVIIIPLFRSVGYAFTDWDGISKSFQFVGLKNFQDILSGKTEFTNAILFTTAIAFINTVLTLVAGVGIAAALTAKIKGSNVFRAMFFLPNTLGGIVLGYIWRFVFFIGFAYLGRLTNLAVFQWEWLGTFPTAFAALVIVSVWQGVGYVMVIMIAALVGVPDDICEGAKVDGASSFQVFFRIKLPYCMPYLTVCMFWVIAQSFKMFDLNTSLTQGGPYGTTVSMALQIYREAFSSNRYGLANAEGLIFFIIIFAITTLQLVLSKKKEEALN